MGNTLIFGGSGFVGRHLTNCVLRMYRGDLVLADIVEPAWRIPPGVHFVSRDVRDPIAPVDGIEFDLVINLAAVHRTPGHPDHEYFETNEQGALNVTAFCRSHNVPRLWFTSSIAVYGPGEERKDEHSALAPTSAYGQSKLAAEAIHRQWAEESPSERKLVIVRPATIFGPGEGGNFTRLAKSLRTRTFVYPGRRDTRKACGYVADLGPSFHFMERFATPIALYNFAYPDPPTIEEICQAFCTTGGFSSPIFSIPAPLLLAVARVLRRAGLAAFHPERVQKLIHSTNIVAAELSGRQYPYRTTLQTALESWYREAPAGEFV